MAEYYAKVNVEKSTEFRFGPNVYPMIALVRGYCVIVDNYRFDNLPERVGSRTDANRLHQVFSQLNFSIIHEKNLTAEKMLHLFDYISKRDELHSHNALVVIILSHGNHGIISGTDYKKDDDERVTGSISIRLTIEKFNDRRCPTLKGKPKMFFLSCCRGDEFDTIETDAIKTSEKDLSDMFVGYGTRLGKVAFRNNRGSFYTVALAEEIIKHAMNMELDELFSKIETNCREKTYKYYDKEFKVKEAEQIPNFEKYKWTKKLYFNPGLVLNKLSSYEIKDDMKNYLIKSSYIFGKKFKKFGFKCHHLTESGPPIIYEVKSDSMASKLNIKVGDIIVKVNNEWTFCDRKVFKGFFKQQKQIIFELILIRLKYLNANNIREIKAINCDIIDNNSSDVSQLNHKLIEQEIEKTQQIGKIWKMYLNHKRDNSEDNDFHYLSIDMNLFENHFKINETEPYIEKDYGIILMSDFEPPLHVKKHFQKLINPQIVVTQNNSRPWIQRLFRSF